MDIPVKTGKTYNIEIEDISSDGQGVGRVNGFTVFVHGALPGDKAIIKIDKVSKKYAVGHVIDMIEPSSYRVDPLCPVADRCGGCHMQALDYKAQLAYKARHVKDALKHIGGLENVQVMDAIGMDEPWRYRNKAQIPVAVSGKDIAMGFFAIGTHDVVDIDACPIQHPVVDDVIKVFKDYIKRYGISVYDEKNGRGLLRHVLVRVGFNSGQVMVVPIINGSELPHQAELIAMLSGSVPGLTSVVLNINRQKTNVILGKECRTLYGSDHIVDQLCGLTFKISALSFYQVNPIQTEVLYNKAIEYARLDGSQTVLDAYCGIGTISLIAAKKAKKVYGIEEVSQAIEDARENARINGINNVEFICGKAEDVIYRFIEDDVPIDIIIMDPPRKGCDPAFLEAAVQLSPPRMVYVSCNPATLARDLRYLHEHGYKVVEVQPVDLFPHTVHVETICRLAKVK